MRFLRRLKVIFLVCLLLLILSGLVLHILLARITSSEEFRKFAERRVSEYVKADVHIGKIRPYHFNQIALERIIIEVPTSRGGSQLVHVERLLFRYHFRQLWEQRFEAPAAVIFRNPVILIDQNQFPYEYFGTEAKDTAGFFIPSVDFKGGEIRYLPPGLGREIYLSEVNGKITPTVNKNIQVDVRAKASGILNGRVRIFGTIQPSTHSHRLILELTDMDFSKDVPLPLKNLSGKIRWVNQNLFFDSLQASLHGWQAAITGAFVNRNAQPEVVLRMRVGRDRPWLKLDLSLDLFLKKIEGRIQAMTEPAICFDGQILREGQRFTVDSIKTDSGFQGRGELDFSTGNYEVVFEKGAKRFAVHSNLKGLDFALYFHLDHWQVLGLDLVTEGKLFLHSATPSWRGKNFLFQGNFETSYFILERQPFDDFAGSFEVTPYGIFGIRTSWGGKFKMNGEVVFPKRRPQGKFLLRVSDFDLGLVQTFASKPLPKELGGILEGKLSLEGELKKPEVTGIFNIRDGKWGQVSYDRGIIQFRGFPPYFPLDGSKIMKGRSTLTLTGAIDLKLDNVFAGVKIETPDHLVIWKGLEAVLHEEDHSLEVHRSQLGGWGELSVLEARAKQTMISQQQEDKGSSKNETGVQFGPKLKF